MIDFKKFFTKVESANPVESMTPKERQDLSSKVESANVIIVAVLIFALPFFFLPTQVDWFDLPKNTFLLLGSLIVVAVWLFRAVLSAKLPVVKSVFFLPLALLALSSVISALLSANKVASLSTDPVVYVGLIFFLIATCQNRKNLLPIILAAGSVLGLLSVLQNLVSLVSPLQTALGNIPYLNPNFSPTGSALSTAIFLAILLPVAVGLYWQEKKLWVVAIALGLISTVFTLFRNPPILLPQMAGWRIAANTLGQSPLTAFFGVGPGNFIDAFTLNKPLDFNNLAIWNLRFTTSSNFYFYLLTTTGITGLAAFLLLAWKVGVLAKKRLQSEAANRLEKGLLGSLVAALVIFALLPAPTVALVGFVTILAVTVRLLLAQENTAYVQEIPDLTANNNLARPAILLATLALTLFAGFYLVQFLLADNAFASSLVAAAANRGTDTYNLQIKASTLNPWNDSYRVSYSQTNLALANALAGQANLTDQQKQTVVALVQQSLRESRLAVALGPNRASNYENLSLIYRNLINFAQGADQWATASQNQAIALDPTNPRLRLDLGGIYFAAKDYQTAGQQFAAAVNLKADYANAHYNLAQAMKLLGLRDQAAQQLQLTASLVCATGKTPDCDRVNAEIAGLAPTPAATPSANLTAPTPATSSNLPKAQTKPPVKVSSPSGELAQ